LSATCGGCEPKSSGSAGPDSGEIWALNIGSLDPIKTISGIFQRLQNLGHIPLHAPMNQDDLALLRRGLYYFKSQQTPPPPDPPDADDSDDSAASDDSSDSDGADDGTDPGGGDDTDSGDIFRQPVVCRRPLVL
jgi:hypothetical protein